MPRLVRVDILDKFRADGGVVVDHIPDLKGAGANWNVEQPDQESFWCKVPVSSRVASALTPRRVLSPRFSDETFDEWRLNEDSTKPLGGDGLIHLTALPPIFVLAECGLYFTTGAGGVRSFSFSLVDVTPSAAITALVLGAPDCPAWVALGTIDPSVLITIEGEFATPLAILFAIRDAVKSAGIACELQLRRNGTTQYLIDLVTQIGASASVPEIRASKQMIDYELKHVCTRQATRVVPRGPVDSSGVDATLARARFKVTAVNGGTKRLTVADDAGGAGPIQYDDQYVSASPAGWFVFREKTGRTFQILHTYKATQEIELADVSDMAAHSVTAPEWISFRLTEALNGTRRVGKTNGVTPVLTTGCPYMVTAVDGGLKKFTLANQFTAPVSDPVSADGEHVDWIAARATPVLSTTATGQTSGVLSCASVTGVAVDDIAIVAGGSLPTASMFQEICRVTAVDSGAKTLTLTGRYSGTTPGNWTGGPLNVYVYRPVATTHLIRASSGSAETITVDAVGTAAANDIIETITQPCQGTLPFYVESPADLAAYGKKVTLLGRPETGEANLVPNSCMRTWTTPTAAPDAWTRSVVSGSPTQSQETTVTRQGGKAWRVQLNSGAGAVATVKTPPVTPHPVDGGSTLSWRLKYQVPTGSLTADSEITFTVRRVSRAGTVLGTSWAASSVVLGGPEHSPTLPDEQIVQRDTWLDLAFEGLDVSQIVNEQVLVEISATGTVEIILDGAQATQTPKAPGAEPDLLIEFAEPTKLLQAANLELVNWAAAPVEFTMSAADLEAIDPTLFAEDKFTLGGTVRAVDSDRSVDLQLRLLQWSPDYLDPRASQYTLATLPRLLTELLGGKGSASAAGSVTASAVAIGGQGTAWDAIAGRPAVFPPSDHSHEWQDVLSAIAGQGPRVGVGRLDSSGDDDIDVISGSPGAATDLMAIPTDGRHFVVVSGQYNQTDAFMDLVCVFETGGYTVGVIGSINVKGTAKPRVYSTGSSTLKVRLDGGGANTYKVRAVALGALTPA